MSTHITGKLIIVGNYTDEEQVDRDSPLARAVVVMPREALKAVCSLPMYEDVLIVTTEEWDQLRRENVELREQLLQKMPQLDPEYAVVKARMERAAEVLDRLSVENALLRKTLTEIASASHSDHIGNWAINQARAALDKGKYFTADQLRSMVKTEGLDQAWVEFIIDANKLDKP